MYTPSMKAWTYWISWISRGRSSRSWRIVSWR